jgi:hypothetical protein
VVQSIDSSGSIGRNGAATMPRNGTREAVMGYRGVG